MRRGSTLRGVFVLLVAMMMIAAGSAYMAVVDFEDLDQGDSVEGMGAVQQYLDITAWSDGDGVVVQDGGVIKAYQGGSGAAPGDETNNLCLTDGLGDQGAGTPFAVPASSDHTWTFEFEDGVLVEDFSIDMLDYGDWFPYGQGTRTATMTAYNASDGVLDSFSFTAEELSAVRYDACAPEGNQRLSVASSGHDIAYVEITFDGVDTGIAFDNIEFNYLCEATEYDLIADGGEYWMAPGGDGWVDVGGVKVWDDGVTLFVQFFTDVDYWEISGIHLHVGNEPGDIPQTKKGNTIPGKFDVKEEFDPWVTETPIYEFDLGDFDGSPVIAAHANLWDSMTMSMVSEPGGANVYGPLTAYAGIGDPLWVNPVSAVATWVHPSWPTIPDATWISNTFYIEDDIAPDTWRLFEATIPGVVMGSYELQTASMVTATADNAEEVYLDGVLVGSDGEVQGPFVDNHEWGTLIDYDLAPLINEGEDNELSFIVRNYRGNASPTSNPTGLIYEVDADYLRGETGWGAGEDFPGSDWSMYLEYFPGVCVLP